MLPTSEWVVEAANKKIKDNLNKKLEDLKGAWVDELQKVLQATVKTATSETPFLLCYGIEAVIPTEISLSSYWVDNFDESLNKQRLQENLDLMDEKREQALSRILALIRIVAGHYNSKVGARKFKVGDLVLKKLLVRNRVFGLNREGPFVVTRIVRPGTYHLSREGRKSLPHIWNAEHLKKYYQ